VIGWENLLRGKFSKQWKIQQKAYVTRRKLRNPFLYKKYKEERRASSLRTRTKRRKENIEDFHAFFQAIIPIIQEIWTDRCIDRNTPVVGGKIVAEYDSLSKKVSQLYTTKEMVLPEDKTKIFNETLTTRLEDTNQQIEKWLTRWKPVVEHSSMKRVKDLARENSKPIWQHSTDKKPAKTRVSRKMTTRTHVQTGKMFDNPLTNVYDRLQRKGSSSRVLPVAKSKFKMNNLISKMFTKLGKKRSTSRKNQ
jgi:hypothetical protein